MRFFIFYSSFSTWRHWRARTCVDVYMTRIVSR